MTQRIVFGILYFTSTDFTRSFKCDYKIMIFCSFSATMICGWSLPLLSSYLTFASMYLLSAFWQKLLHWDHDLFVQLNGQWTNPFFDTLMPFLRNSITWIPLYLFLLVLVLVNFRKKAYWWILFFLVTVALTDMTGTNFFKHGFHRIRPCNNPDLLAHLRLLVPCPGGFSFISNHAANHFGMATFLLLSFRHLLNNWIWLVFLWAAVISYAQVYVGVHYPSDIAGGMVLGIFYGTLTGFVFNKYFGLHHPVPDHP
jgi:membrane-associated phospholipid phosphatase